MKSLCERYIGTFLFFSFLLYDSLLSTVVSFRRSRVGSSTEKYFLCRFECIVGIEREVLIPVFGNLQLLAAVGNRFYSFIKAQFRSNNSFSLLEDIFKRALLVNSNSLVNADVEVNALLDKFEDFYLHTRFNDFIIAQLPRVNKVLSGRSNSVLGKIGFRDKIKVGAVDDNRREV